MASEVPNNWKALRQRSGLTQRHVAQYLGLASTDRISKWEKGVMYSHVRTFIKLLALYHVPPNAVYSQEVTGATDIDEAGQSLSAGHSGLSDSLRQTEHHDKMAQ